MSVKTSMTVDELTSYRLGVLAELENRGKLDELRDLIAERRKKLGLTEKRLDEMVRQKMDADKKREVLLTI